jgi:hypothetical protein
MSNSRGLAIGLHLSSFAQDHINSLPHGQE